MPVHGAITQLYARDAKAALDFYARAFGAREKFRLVEGTGRIGHAQIELGGTTLMIADEMPDHGALAPRDGTPTGVCVHLQVDDCDGFVKRASDAGATVLVAPSDRFFGQRSARVRDPFGHEWALSQTIEEVSAAEIQRRFADRFGR